MLQKFITPDMTILEVVYQHRQTEAVFRQYDAQAGGCLCCQGLFDSLAEVAQKYRIDLDKLLADLEAVASKGVLYQGLIQMQQT